MNNLRKGIGGAILTLAVVFGISAATGITAQAQYRNDDGYYRRDNRRDDNQERNREWRRRRNRDRREDRRDNRNYGYGNNGGYNNGGYNNGGYNNGGYNNGGYNNSRYEQQQGYQAGLNTGASDGQRGQSFNPQRSRHYRNTSSQAFRNGFLQGYNQGYRQYSGNRNGGYRRDNRGILGTIFGRP